MACARRAAARMSATATTGHPPAEGTLVAIDVGGTRTKLACFDVATAALRRSQVLTHAAGVKGRAALQRLIDAARRCARGDGARPVLGVAAVFPGIVCKDHLFMAPNAITLEGIDLRQAFEAAFGTATIVLDNDVKAGALAEHAWGALRGAAHALYVNVGTGLAAAAVIDGEVYRGRNGAALEIGYQLAPTLDVSAPARWQGFRDNLAPTEALFSGAALDALAGRLLGPACSAKDLFQSARADIRAELAQRLNLFRAQLVNLAIAFDVERIAIGGGVSRQYSTFAPGIEAALQRLVPFPPALLSARFAYDASLWGALELARRACRLPELPEAVLSAPADPASEPVAPVSAWSVREGPADLHAAGRGHAHGAH